MHPINQAFTDMAKHAKYLQRELTPHEQAAYLQGHQDGMVYAHAALSPPQPVAGWRERCVVVQYTDGSCDVDSPCHAYWLDTKGYWRDWENGEDKFRTDRKGRFDSPVAAMDALAACPTPPPGVTP